MAEAVLHPHREVDRLVDVPHAHDREHGHHLLGPGQAVVARHVADEQPRRGLRLDADLGEDLRRVLADPGRVHVAGLPRLAGLREDDPLEAAQLVLLEQVGAVLGHRPDEPVGDRVDDEDDLLVDADEVVVERGAADDVAGRPLDVGGLVDDGRRVAGARR